MGRNVRPVLVLAGLLLAGCGGDDTTDTDSTDTTVPPAPTDPTEPTWHDSSPDTHPPTVPPSAPTVPVSPTTPEPATMISVADEHLAFTLALPDEHALVGSGQDDFAGGGACVYYRWQLQGGVFVEAWPASCDPANSEPGNGSYGHYRTVADAPSGVPAGDVETVLGPATLAEQVYYECTNSCDEWPLDIAIIELSEPVDDEYPTVAVVQTHRDATPADLIALLESFGAG